MKPIHNPFAAQGNNQVNKLSNDFDTAEVLDWDQQDDNNYGNNENQDETPVYKGFTMSDNNNTTQANEDYEYYD